MSTPQIAKQCRIAGRVVIVSALLFLFFGGAVLNHYRDRDPSYHPRPDGESTTVFAATWWPRVLAGSALGVVGGSVLLFVASRVETWNKGQAT